MFVGTVDAEEIIEIPRRDKPPVNGAAPATNSGERMTEPQKRYLFRLLAAQKMEGKAAEEHLKTYFHVARLTEIPKDAASAYIDQLVKDPKDAAS
jgi:hypothetical protein